MFHIKENAAAGFQKQIRWNEKCGILKPDADAVLHGFRMEDDIVPVGYEIEKIMTENRKRRAAKRNARRTAKQAGRRIAERTATRTAGEENIAARFILQLEQSVFIQRRGEPQKRICQKVDGVGRKTGDPDVDFLHKMFLCAGK